MSDDLEQRLSGLGADAWAPPQPPELDREAAFAARPPRRRLPRWERAPRARMLAAGFALVVVGVLIGRATEGPGGDAPDPGRAVALAALGDAPSSAAGQARVTTRSVALRVDALPASRRGEFYELWALKTPQRLVSLGTFRVGADGKAQVRVPLSVDVRDFPVLDVSVERADGNPAHSGLSVLRS